MDLKLIRNKIFYKNALIYAILFITLIISLLKDLQLLGIIALIILIYLIEPNKFEHLFKKVFKKISFGPVGLEAHTEDVEVTIEKSLDENQETINKDYYTLYLEGDKLLSNGDYEQAAKKYEESINLNDKYTNAYINLGVAYQRLWSNTKDRKYLEKSANASKKALELTPDGYRPRINLAVVYSKSDETKDEALKLFEEADEIGKTADPLTRGKVKLFKSQLIIDKLQTNESKKYEVRIPEILKDLNDSTILFSAASWKNPEALYWIQRPKPLSDYIKSGVWK